MKNIKPKSIKDLIVDNMVKKSALIKVVKSLESNTIIVKSVNNNLKR